MQLHHYLIDNSSTVVPNSAHTPCSTDFFSRFSKGCEDQPLWLALCCVVGRKDPETQIKQTNETTLWLAQQQLLTLYILQTLRTSSVVSQKAAKTNQPRHYGWNFQILSKNEESFFFVLDKWNIPQEPYKGPFLGKKWLKLKFWSNFYMYDNDFHWFRRQKYPTILGQNMENPTIVATRPCAAAAAWPLTER